MINTPGAQAQANKHAGRNRPSDIDELRDNIADIASGVGDMASCQYAASSRCRDRRCRRYCSDHQAQPARLNRCRPRCWLPVGAHPYGRSRSPSLTDLPIFPILTGDFHG